MTPDSRSNRDMETPAQFPPSGAAAETRASRGGMEPVGSFVTLDGEDYYRIADYHRLRPFLMSLTSDTDLWMFVTSGGGLTAGRVDSDGSLFPYETVDRLHDGHHHTGPVTLVRVLRDGEPPLLWRPLSESSAETHRVERNLFKNAIGNRLVFEEINRDLGLVFRYRWSPSDDFGWVRRASIENLGRDAARIEILDGFRNLQPFGVSKAMNQQTSNLVDAYKKNEIDPATQLGVYSMTAGISDRAEALAMLRANTVWHHGLEDCRIHLSGDAIGAFRRGEDLPTENILNGARGNYLVAATIELAAGEQRRWYLVGDVGRSHVDIADLRARLRARADLAQAIEASLDAVDLNLLRNVGSADGLQLTGHTEASVHHFANVLFNNMRGGVFVRNSDIPADDLAEFVTSRNRRVAKRCGFFLESLPEALPVSRLIAEAKATGDADLERLCFEYLPVHFGRRHGDPSRPWNRFSIKVRTSDGERALRYEGNWRDIFQNWEALGASFPEFLPSIVAKFVNASTIDGFNPYRITREGVDWEKVDPEDPWSYIGYWGDHQIIYLLKFLEAMERHYPGHLMALLDRDIFSYAEVPYRLAPYEQILADPRSTIEFDDALDRRIEERREHLGADGKLLSRTDGTIYHANLVEKLLVTTLAKISNLVPDGGIWMNTQRPEWNDANNALVGGGVSVVTLAYLRRFLAFMEGLLADANGMTVMISSEVVDWFREVVSVLDRERDLLEMGQLSDRHRMRLLDGLGEAYSAYREAVYGRGFSGKRRLAVQEIQGLCRIGLDYLGRGLRANRREDGLYHAYNLLEIQGDGEGAALVHLEEMLEGQVAALSSGLPDADEALGILNRLYESPLYRADQNSFLLYPERVLPGFLEKNVVPDAKAESLPLLRDLMAVGDGRIIARDAAGACRFHGDFRNAKDLAAALDTLRADDRWREAVERDRRDVMELFESVFRHRAYTGRSGAMYGYEGLGCIYWHMVAKLLLAVQEILQREEREGSSCEERAPLTRMYYRIRSGLGFEKSVAEYGAFPMDPYSHTPPDGGARQPGMTGQVKEEILTRLGELGLRVEHGALRFRPSLLRSEEFLSGAKRFRYIDIDGVDRSIELSADSLVYTYCQVPVVYEKVEGKASIRLHGVDGSVSEIVGLDLDEETSRRIFARDGEIRRIDVAIPAGSLCRF